MPAIWRSAKSFEMSWGKYLVLFGLSTFKFMFAPLGGIPMKLSFWETYFSCIAGAIFTAAVCFYLSEYFMRRAERKKNEKLLKALESGLQIPATKNFTFLNKMVVRVRKIFGIYGICMLAPLFLSVPGGTIVSAKFYRKDKRAFPLIVLGICINGFVLTSIFYLRHILH